MVQGVRTEETSLYLGSNVTGDHTAGPGADRVCVCVSVCVCVCACGCTAGLLILHRGSNQAACLVGDRMIAGRTGNEER